MTKFGTVAVTDHPFRDLDIERSILAPEGHRVAEHQPALDVLETEPPSRDPRLLGALEASR